MVLSNLQSYYWLFFKGLKKEKEKEQNGEKKGKQEEVKKEVEEGRDRFRIRNTLSIVLRNIN